MNMTTKIRHTDAVAIVDISGRVVLGEECTSLGKLLSDLIGKGHNRILLNLADVDRIDSAVAHALERAGYHLMRRG